MLKEGNPFDYICVQDFIVNESEVKLTVFSISILLVLLLLVVVVDGRKNRRQLVM